MLSSIEKNDYDNDMICHVQFHPTFRYVSSNDDGCKRISFDKPFVCTGQHFILVNIFKHGVCI